MEIGADRSWRESTGQRRGLRVVEPDIARERQWRGERGIGRGWDGDVGHRLIDHARVRRADGRAAVTGRIPDHADTRRDVVGVVIELRPPARADAHQRPGGRVEDDETVLRFLR